MALVWRWLRATEHYVQSMLRLRPADCNAGYVKMARILRGVAPSDVWKRAMLERNAAEKASS